ncbi:MAG: hypothetical protein ABI165_13815, partial [Bryobacteraceae bacterium]
WFLGLFQMLNGSMHPALLPLARRAIAGLPIAFSGATAAFALSYFRVLRKIVEEPDIASRSRGARWSPRFGNPLETAIGLFSVRTLLRSRQHRLILSFYLGAAFAIGIALLKTPAAQQQLVGAAARDLALCASSIVLMGLCILGIRIAFALPRELRANWIFRVAPIRELSDCLAASRRALYVLAIAPVWAASAALFLSIWPWRAAAIHLAVLGLLAMILSDLFLHHFHKIPFTCSYLPGKSNFHLAFWAGILLLQTLLLKATQFERRTFEDPALCFKMLGVLGVAAICARWRTRAHARSQEAVLRFEEAPPEDVLALGLFRDGVLPDSAANTPPPTAG